MDAVSHLTSALSGRYAIEREIGRGGMATVYLARDLRHKRNVAFKVLNPELGAVLGVERFLAEIQVTAILQHPNLLPLFDSGEVDGLLFYVMPFVEGESLRARLERDRQLPVDEAIRLTVAVAGALDYAHRHGIIHRDLKPENILLHEGQPLVADFGIALAISNAGGGRVTQTGLSLGTPQYMSPEQATGDRVIDGRSDVYSLAAVAYEMLAGEAPHVGNTAQAIIGKLMTEDVRPITVLRRTVPPHIDASIRRALEKLPADRFATAAQFAESLSNPAGFVASAEALPASRLSRGADRLRRPVPWTAAALGLGVAAVALLRPAVPVLREPMHFTLPMPSGYVLDPVRVMVGVSPTGSHIAYTAARDGIQRILIKLAGESQAREIPGTDGASSIFFSPGGDSIGFWSGEQLKKVAVNGGPVFLIARVKQLAGGAWLPNDEIVVSLGQSNPLSKVAAGGGELRPFTTLDSIGRETTQLWPTAMPDGSVLFTSFQTTTLERHIAIAAPDGRVTSLDLAGSNAIFVEPGWIVYMGFDGSVLAAPFDVRRRRVSGPSIVLARSVYLRDSGFGVFSAARDGSVLVYAEGAAVGRLATLSPRGEVQTLDTVSRRFSHPHVSPDGKRITLRIVADDGTSDVWIYEISSGGLTRRTLDGRSNDGVWSPDGLRIAFSRGDSTTGLLDVYEVAADGRAAPRLLVGGAGSQFTGEWTAGGFIYEQVTGTQTEIWALSGDGKRAPLVKSATRSARQPTISPDGQWMAYISDESNEYAVYVRSMKGAGKWPVSNGRGDQPVWSRDGRTLYYRDRTNIVAVSVGPGPAFTTTGKKIFPDPFEKPNVVNMAALPDGRLVGIVPVEQSQRLDVIANWSDEIRRRTDPKRSR